MHVALLLVCVCMSLIAACVALYCLVVVGLTCVGGGVSWQDREALEAINSK